MAFDIEMIRKLYANFPERIKAARKAVGRPLTLTEKILYAHLWQGSATHAFEKGKSYVGFAPERAGPAGSDEPAQAEPLPPPGPFEVHTVLLWPTGFALSFHTQHPAIGQAALQPLKLPGAYPRVVSCWRSQTQV